MELRMNPMSVETSDSGEMTVSGYVNKTNQPSHILGRKKRFRERIAKGAFTRAISKVDEGNEIHFFAEHDNSKILASTRNGSLSLEEDEQGLRMTATIAPTSWGKDYYELIKSGILRNMSFGFKVLKDAWRKGPDGIFERDVTDLELLEVSVVRDPAYSQSTIAARGIDLVEEVDIPEFSVEIRSKEDLETIAQELFKMLQSSVKIEEEKKVEENEEVVEDQKDETKDQPEDKTEQVVDETKDEGDKGEDKTDPEPEDKLEEKQDEQKNTEETKETEKSDSDKLRDFINQYKQEEK